MTEYKDKTSPTSATDREIFLNLIFSTASLDGFRHMLRTTKKEREHVESYVRSQLPKHGLELAQKVYSERVHAERHDIWDVHTKRSRWWMITNPTNLYSQKQFPNMDLALTFHVGWCLRVPNNERKAFNDLPIESLILRPLTSAPFVISVAGWVSPWRSNQCPLSGTDKFPTRNAS
jgi:hypothetical protein